jgi:hypothetical protein
VARNERKKQNDYQYSKKYSRLMVSVLSYIIFITVLWDTIVHADHSRLAVFESLSASYDLGPVSGSITHLV